MAYRGTASDGSDRSDRLSRLFGPAVPYAAVLVGLYVLESAWAAVLLYHAGVIAIWFAAGRRPQARALLSGLRPRFAIPLVLAGLAVAPIVYFAWPHVALDPEMRAVLARFGLRGFPLAAFAVYSALANPALEELLWRGVLFAETRQPAPGDAVFAGYHVIVLAVVVEWPFALAAALVLAAAAWIWRVVAARSGGLAVPWLSHLAADLAVIGAAWALMAR
jgi:membrane protease YdiL (CAAX protease family)